MTDYVLMDWQPVRDAYPKIAQATDAGRQYVIWEQADGYQVAARTVGGHRQVKWHQTAYGIAAIGDAITQAEQWRWALAQS